MHIAQSHVQRNFYQLQLQNHPERRAAVFATWPLKKKEKNRYKKRRINNSSLRNIC